MSKVTRHYLRLRSEVTGADQAVKYAYVRMSLSNERVVTKFFYPWLNLIFLSIVFVDLILNIVPAYSLALRLTVCLFSIPYWKYSRGKIRYSARYSFLMFCYSNVVLAIALLGNRFDSIYMAGFFIVTGGASLLYPMKFKNALILQVILCLPAIFISILFVWTSNYYEESLLFIVFACSSWLVSASGSEFRYQSIFALNVMQSKIRRSEHGKETEIQELGKSLSRRKVFERQVSPTVAKWMLDHPSKLGIIDKKKLVIVSLDIANSTEKAFTLDIRTYASVCYEILELYCDICKNSGLTMDKYMGDGFLCFAGAPLDNTGCDVTAVLATIEDFWKNFDLISDSLQRKWQDELTIRFSITVGKSLVGVFGRNYFASYTAMGPMVSLACRINGKCRNRRVLVYFQDNRDVVVPKTLQSEWLTIPKEELKGVPSDISCLDVEVG